jgi:hypothetical protein
MQETKPSYQQGKIACIYGPSVDTSIIKILPHIQEWIMIEEVGPKGTNRLPTFKNFFTNLKRAMKLVDMQTISKETDICWTFQSTVTATKVFYYHSIDIEQDKIPEDLKLRLKHVDTVVNGGITTGCVLVLLCPNIKYYLTSGNYGDYANGYQRYFQHWIHANYVKCECWLMPDQSTVHELLYFVINGNYNVPDEHLLQAINKHQPIVQYQSLDDIDNYLRTTEEERAASIKKYSTMYPLNSMNKRQLRK